MMRTSAFLTAWTLFFSAGSLAGTSAYSPPSDAKRAAEAITKEGLRSHTRFLSSDLLEGRAPASTGDLLAREYISAQFERLGLKPALDNGSWFQEFELIGIDSQAPKQIHPAHGSGGISFQLLKDYIVVSGVQKPVADVTAAEIVFVGYGIVAPEYDWDDYKDVDVRGKILLMMNNDPANDPNLFAGKTRLYYGRWDYKYEIAAKKGAAGALIIHTNDSAGYPWQVVESSWSGEAFELPKAPGEPEVLVKGWLTENAYKGLVRLSGKDLDLLRASAEKRDFRPVSLKTTLTLSLQNKLRRVKTENVLGVLPGTDKERAKEAIVYMAHFDHLGKKPGVKPGQDSIYNGARDNASGVSAILNIAEAFSRLEKKPKRSVIFAAMAAEESGLLGSEYFCKNSPFPASKLEATINIDGINIFGPTKDISFVGYGKSSLDRQVESMAKMQGRTVKPDPFPDRGFFYRSDQFNFAKIGVPSAYFGGGVDVIGKPPGWGLKAHEEWESKHYHQPSDELTPDWNFEGGVQDAVLDFYLGYDLAQSKEVPVWNKGDEFEATRLHSLAAAAQK